MQLFETFLQEAYGEPGSAAMGNGNFQSLWNFYRGRRTAPNLTLDFGNDNILQLSDNDVNKLIDYYNELKTNDQRKQFVYQTMSRLDKFLRLLEQLGIEEKTYTPQGMDQLKLLEKEQRASKEVASSKTQDPKLAAVLSKAYAKFPTASSDLEAFVRQTYDQDADQDQNISQQSSVNDRQDSLLSRLRTVSQKQSQQLAALDRENSELDKEIQDLEAQLDKVGSRSQVTQVAQQTRKKQRTAKADTEKKSAEEPGSTTSAAKGRRAPAAKKGSGKPQQRLRPGTATKSGEKTPAPAVTTPKPDATQAADIPLPTSIAQTQADTQADLFTEPDSGAADVSSNVLKFPSKIQKTSPDTDLDAANDPRGQAYAESNGSSKRELADYIQQARGLGRENKLSHAAAWARRYPHLHADIAEAKKSGDHARLDRLHKIKRVIDSAIAEQSGMGFGE